MLLRLLASIARPARRKPPSTESPPLEIPLDPSRRNVLNVGGGPRDVVLPPHYAQWKMLFLDVDPACKPDIVLDARALGRLPAAQFDAVYCSHNLEHYYAHDVGRVLGGFAHVLKPGAGFVEVRVPDLQALAREIAVQGRDLDDTLYVAPAGPVRVLDVLYGYGPALEQSGEDFYAHKTGFTQRTLTLALQRAGFAHVVPLAPLALYEIRVLALRSPPGALHRELFRLGTPAPAPGPQEGVLS